MCHSLLVFTVAIVNPLCHTFHICDYFNGSFHSTLLIFKDLTYMHMYILLLVSINVDNFALNIEHMYLSTVSTNSENLSDIPF